MHEVLVNRLGGLSLPRKSVVRLTDRPDITLDVYRGRKTIIQQQQQMYAICVTKCKIYIMSLQNGLNLQHLNKMTQRLANKRQHNKT